MTSYVVFTFGGGTLPTKTRASRDKTVSWRQGRKPRRAWRDRPAGAARASPSPPRNAVHWRPIEMHSVIGKSLSTTALTRRKSPAALPISKPCHGQACSAMQGRSAARLGPLWRARFDAGHDGYRAQSGPQRRHGRGLGRRHRAMRASPGTAIAASSRCIPTWCWPRSSPSSKMRWKSPRKTTAITLDVEMRRRTGRRWSSRVQGDRRSRRAGPRPSRRNVHEQLWGAIGAVFDSWDADRAKVYRRLNDIPGGLGHGGQRAGDGVRQHGRRPAATAWPSPAIRRPARTPITANGWSTRRAKTSSPGIRTPQYLTKAARERAGAKPLSMEEAMPAAFADELAPCPPELLETALSRHAGHRIHGGTRQVVDAADPHRQTHRQGRAQDRRRYGTRKG